jgi:hypothetical protein
MRSIEFRDDALTSLASVADATINALQTKRATHPADPTCVNVNPKVGSSNLKPTSLDHGSYSAMQLVFNK